MDKFLMFWACLNFAVSVANLVNLQRLRKEQKAAENEREKYEALVELMRQGDYEGDDEGYMRYVEVV